MKTSQRQIFQNGEEKSTFSQEDFRVSRSAWQENGEDRMMTATSGRKCFALYGKYSRLGLLAKMLLESSRWYSPARRLVWDAKPIYSERLTEKEYSYGKNTSSRSSAEISNVKDIPSSRLLFRLVPLERHTEETGYGLSQGVLLPTPRATEIVEDPYRFVKRTGDRTMNCVPNLSSMAAFRPWMLPTPTASCHKAGTTKDRKDGISRESELNHFVAKQIGETFQLNPLFVQEMMGFPSDWLVSPFQDGDKNP